MSDVLYETKVYNKHIVGFEFTGTNTNETQYLFKVAPHKENRNCAFQVISKTRVDCHNENLAEFVCEVLFVIDTPYANLRPLTLDFLELAHKAVDIMREMFEKEVLPHTSGMSTNMIKKFDDQFAIMELKREINEAYPVECGVRHL